MKQSPEKNSKMELIRSAVERREISMCEKVVRVNGSVKLETTLTQDVIEIVLLCSRK